MVLDDKKPLEDNAMRLLLSVERSISLAREYVLNFDAEEAELLHEEIEEESINVETLMEFMEYSDSIKENLTQITTLYQEFYQAKEELVEHHNERIGYTLTLSDQQTDLKSFILQQRIALNDWLDALALAAKIKSTFNPDPHLEKRAERDQ